MQTDETNQTPTDTAQEPVPEVVVYPIRDVEPEPRGVAIGEEMLRQEEIAAPQGEALREEMLER